MIEIVEVFLLFMIGIKFFNISDITGIMIIITILFFRISHIIQKFTICSMIKKDEKNIMNLKNFMVIPDECPEYEEEGRCIGTFSGNEFVYRLKASRDTKDPSIYSGNISFYILRNGYRMVIRKAELIKGSDLYDQ